jgi:heme exporter protein CcmD
VSYLLGAYGFALVVLAGYAVHVARRSRAAAARLRELDSDR